MSRKTLSIISLSLIILMMFVTACSSNQTAAPPQDGSSNEQGQETNNNDSKEETVKRTDLVFGIPQDPQFLTAGRSNGQIPNIMQTQLYNNLLRTNPDGSYSPELAKNWEVSDDNLTYTFYLRDDVLFHDGSKMTSKDVAFSFDYHAGKLADYPSGTQARSFLNFYEETEIIDEYTVKIHYSKVYGPTLSCLSDIILGILPEDAFLSTGQDEFEKHPIGTGPYKFISKVPGETIKMQANEDYFDGIPSIKDLTFSIRLDTDAAVIALQTGELDFVTNIATSYKNTIDSDSNLKWFMTDSPGQGWVIFNTGINTDKVGSKYFSDVRLRQAVAYAVDKEDINIASTDGYGKIINSPIPNTFAGYTDVPDYYTRDLNKAEELLIDAGYPNGFSVNLRCITTPTYYKPAETLIGQLAEIGINATLEVLESGAYWTSIMTNYDYDIAIGNYTATTPDADIPLMQHYYTDATLRYTNHSIKELDDLLDKARSELDKSKREEAYAKAVEVILKDNCLVVPLYQFVVTGAGNANLQNVNASPYVDWKISDWSW
ncbi:ABC transporter substrate-binding protein [Sedimentibacter hydroxybenzoicus DSM 7310]|uniref:ABC transporter substrate-binding protein n=1 Tax=Sedimentibacter hydroxybenzoicus DSM 7310 TaxID=1123245 RepID=A0A974BH09_SEDHY|nr:ABC transporter substrate-binding protein [Sedimentibacter hydroxybenzoicus]NYB72716.1 ABC transporter substrate-binding protein [Sedimentibacter hydroxybenzoicus DSM 7310]